MTPEQKEQFHKLLSDNVSAAQWMNPPMRSAEQDKWFQQYQAYMHKTYRTADLAGVVDANQKLPIGLAQVFVEERFTRTNLYKTDKGDDLQTILKKSESLSLEQLLVSFDEDNVPQAVDGKAVIIGEPGSGKSVQIQMLASNCSAPHRNLYNAHYGRRLVVPIILRQLKLDESLLTPDELLQRWRDHLNGIEKDLVDLKHVSDLLKRGWGILCLDGMDEINVRARHVIWRIYHQFKEAFPQSAVLVTGRPVGFQEILQSRKQGQRLLEQQLHLFEEEEKQPSLFNSEVMGHAFKESARQAVYLRPFDDEQIIQYVNNWFLARLPEQKHEREEKVESLLPTLNSYESLQVLKRRPIFLAILTYVHDARMRLPISQVLAYEEMVTAYLSVLDEAKRLKDQTVATGKRAPDFDLQDKWRVLQRLAYDLHTNQIPESVSSF
uniref:Putative signal transduction protein with Nacht domain n=1 Tax=Magnetococcus massalia (strain MO-1) TaxID=451514 RepID=A0A1S7LPB7_MAGMO